MSYYEHDGEKQIYRESICCFTGHRTDRLPWKKDETDPRCVLLRERLAVEIERAYHSGTRMFICGMARGIDMLAAEAVLKAKEVHQDILFEAAIPCEGQTDGWSEAERERYETILKQSDRIPLFLPPKGKGVMMQRNRYMVEKSGRIIAIYDGIDKGGTFQTLIMAIQEELKVVLIDPEHPDRCCSSVY